MPETFGRKCSKACDFIIALQGHDFETIEEGAEVYDQCPSCGADLEPVYVYQPDFGFLKVAAGGENQ